MLSPNKAVEQAVEAKRFHDAERDALDKIRRYWTARQRLPAVIPSTAPAEVRTMARIARVNVCKIVVDTLTQSSYATGFRGEGESEDAEIWDVWQKNRLDARQTGIHRAAYAYGASYATVLPGDPVPVIRGVSPRRMIALYGEDPDWPMVALQHLSRAPDGKSLWRLWDEEGTYFLSGDDAGEFKFVSSEEHGVGVTPVVRFLDEEDLDADDDVEADHRLFGEFTDVPARGQVVPLFPLQDQVDLTTFNLLVAQHYSAFRQRWILGWLAESEEDKMKAGASQLWSFESATDEEGDEIKIGEFGQTDLKGYIDSREASLRHAATLSQTPVHELTGQLINLSAEALVAAEKGRERKVDEREKLGGESHEQLLWLAGKASDPVIEVPDDAQIVWSDTSARAFSATVDALGKLVTMLGIPPQELWERVPGATRQDVERWKRAAQQGDSFAVLADLLERQANNGGGEPALVG